MTVYRLMIHIFFIVLLITGCRGVKTNPLAVEGTLDLSSWDFEKDGIAYLDGQWEFYWGRLISPKQFNAGDVPVNVGYFFIPGYWNGYLVNGSPLAGDGYATFQLKVRLKPGEKRLAIRIEDQSTAYRLWVNGSLVMENGIVADNADAMRPYRKISTAFLQAGAEDLDCVLQVSNFHLSNGGPYRGIALGTSDEINERQSLLFAVDLLLCGILGFIGFYHLVFYLLRTRETSLLYFGFTCLCWSAGTPFGAMGGRFITLIFPGIPWYWVARMELLTWFPIVPLLLMFFASLFPLEFSSKVTGFAKVFGVAFFAFVIFAPSGVVSLTEVPYQIFSMVVISYICLGLYRAVRQTRSEAGLMLAGFLFLVGTVINDILYMNLIIYSVYLVSSGIGVMILFQTFVLARRFARSFAAVETLTGELEKKNIALSKLDKLKDEFLANTSHELRTPLNGIIGIAESLISGITGRLPERTQENLSMIVASGKRLAGLIDDILDFSRLKNRDIRLQRQPVDMRALAHAVLTIMRPLATGKSLTLRGHIPDTLPPVWGDEDRLQQILYNLIGNAVKFTDQGEIKISALQRGDLMEVCVTDTGIGIPEDHQEDIFRPFKQVDASDGRTYGGAGLGLSITRKLIELHGGAITIQSAPNQGATFRFTLPIVGNTIVKAPGPSTREEGNLDVIFAASPKVADEPEPAANLSDFNKPIRILAVDDDPVNLRVVANHLVFKNVEVITAASGRQAIEAIEDGLLPDLVLLDIMMPGMTGYELSRWLRQRYSASELPVIMLTAKKGAGALVEGYAQGANDYLVKPFVKDELLARVVSQLKLKESYLTLRENLTLRRELEERKQVERELRILQQSLSRMLDSVDEALLAVNEGEEITFCNRGCEELLGYDAQDLLGRPFAGMLRQTPDAKGSPGVKKLAFCPRAGDDGNQDLGTVSLRRADGVFCEVRVFISFLNVDEASIRLMVLRKKDGQGRQGSTVKRVEQSLGVIEAINRNRSRLQSIQASLDDVLPVIHEKQPELLNELKAIDEALDNAGKAFLQDENYESRRHLAVEVMGCALEYWTESTGLTKTELAHQSRLWKVYTNLDGWERTQTLDRYLNLESFPQKPAWKKIYKTAEFVLAACEKPSALRNRLEVLLMKLRVSR